MRFLNAHPKLRILFSFTYTISAIWFFIRDYSIFSFIISIILLFMSYISLIKAGIIKNPNARNISTLKFDLLSILSVPVIIIEMFL